MGSNSDYDISKEIKKLLSLAHVDINMFEDKTLLITGGTGFFGVWLLTALLEISSKLKKRPRLIVLSRCPERFIKTYPNYDFSRFIEFIGGDIQTFELRDVKVDYLVHMATTNAEETYRGEDQINKLRMLYEGTRNVLEQCGPSLKKVLFTSSGVAYGLNYNELISEDDCSGLDTTKLGSSLGIGKLVAEYLIAYYSDKYDYEYSIGRCFSFAGQHLPLGLHYAFGNFVKNVLDGHEIVIHGDGQDKRSYLYIGDAIMWLLRLLTEPKNQIYNVGSDQSIRIKELAKAIVNQAKSNVGVKVLNKDIHEGNFKRATYIPSVEKIKRDYIGLDIWTDLDNIIDRMIHSHG